MAGARGSQSSTATMSVTCSVSFFHDLNCYVPRCLLSSFYIPLQRSNANQFLCTNLSLRYFGQKYRTINSQWQDFSAEAAKRAVVFSQGADLPAFPFDFRADIFPSVTDTLNQTTKGLPIVGGVTEPLLDTVGGVTDGLPIVSCSNL